MILFGRVLESISLLTLFRVYPLLLRFVASPLFFRQRDQRASLIEDQLPYL